MDDANNYSTPLINLSGHTGKDNLLDWNYKKDGIIISAGVDDGIVCAWDVGAASQLEKHIFP